MPKTSPVHSASGRSVDVIATFSHLYAVLYASVLTLVSTLISFHRRTWLLPGRPTPLKPSHSQAEDTEDLPYHPDEAQWRARTARRLAEDPTLPSTPLPSGFPKELKGPLVWEGKDWKDDSDWTYTLSGEELREVDDAVKSFEALGIPINRVSKETFPLPTLGPSLESLSRELHFGRGFIVIRTIPVDTYTPFQNMVIYAGISKYIAPTFAVQDPGTGAVVGHITDLTRTYEEGLLGAASYTSDAQPFHNDPGDIVSLFCLDVAGGGGGESKLASAWRVYNELARTRPDLVQVLSQPVPFEIFNAKPPNNCRLRPIVFHHDGKVIVKNARRLCTGFLGLPRSKDIPQLSDAQKEAIDTLHFLAERYHVRLTIKKGDIQYVNDLSMFHARDPFTDTPGKRRHLLRIWMRNEELAWKTPPGLAKRWVSLYNAVKPENQRFPLQPEIRTLSRGAGSNSSQPS